MEGARETVNIFRRLPLTRLLLLCGATVAIGVSATAIALALDSGPTPPAKPLAQAVHDVLAAPPVQGYTATIQLTDHLVEGAELASGGQSGSIASSPLLTGATGRLWVSDDGRLRLELQAEKGDTQILYDGHTVTIYDAASNTVYRYTPKSNGSPDSHPSSGSGSTHQTPSVQEIEKSIADIRGHAGLSGATPTDVAGQPAYTVRVSPSEAGSLIGGAELSFDASHGLPLRAAIYSSKSSSPVIELAAKEVAYGPVDSSVFSFTPPASAKVQELELSSSPKQDATSGKGAGKPDVTTSGHGISSIAVLRSKAKSGSSAVSGLEGLPKVSINGTSASELRTELGTILTFERAGVRYVLAGAVEPSAVEALAKGL
jgi:outer membrane lipoprotein-sorting protein